MMKYKAIYDPLRPCISCGDVGNSYASTAPSGLTRYTSKCKKCLNLEMKKKEFDVCFKCGCDKKPSYNRYCSNCLNRINWNIQPEELLIIKRWCRKQELRNWMTDLQGLNELITIYYLVTHKEGEYDNMESSEQFKNMWEKVLSVYNEIKDISDDNLKDISLNKIDLKIKKKENMLKKLNNNDLDFFFKIIENFEFEGKTYTLEQEYLDCISGHSKVSCVRCRKIIQEMRRELLRLRGKTGVKYKYGKK